MRNKEKKKKKNNKAPPESPQKKKNKKKKKHPHTPKTPLLIKVSFYYKGGLNALTPGTFNGNRKTDFDNGLYAIIRCVQPTTSTRLLTSNMRFTERAKDGASEKAPVPISGGVGGRF